MRRSLGWRIDIAASIQCPRCLGLQQTQPKLEQQEIYGVGVECAINDGFAQKYVGVLGKTG